MKKQFLYCSKGCGWNSDKKPLNTWRGSNKPIWACPDCGAKVKRSTA